MSTEDVAPGNDHGIALQCGGKRNTMDDSSQLMENESLGALPKINNQNTIIMRAASQPENQDEEPDLMLMHNSRIFFFERDPKVPESDDVPPLDKAADEMTCNINDILMTPKYRSLSAFYLLFHLLDHAILVSIILSLFTGQNAYLSFAGVILRHWELFVVIALEVVYDVLEYNVRVWILNRVSLYFVLVLYGLYVTVVTYNNMWDVSVTVLLSVRFLSFICELVVDFFIDLELDCDLRDGKIHALEVQCITRTRCGNIGYELKKEHKLDKKVPKGWNYKGSIVSWTPLNVFDLDSDQFRTENLEHRKVFEMMVMFTIIITFPVTIIVGIIMGILSGCVQCCTCFGIKYKNTVFAECTRKQSW